MVILSLGLGIGFVAAIITGVIIVRTWSPPLVDCDYVVVLGAGVNGTRPSLSLQERIDAAYDYLVAYPNAVCIVSGGQGNGENITEAQCMYNELIKRGIDADRLYMEDRSTSTRENIAFSKEIIEKEGLNPCLAVVSNNFHLYRASLVVEAHGLSFGAVPAFTPYPLLFTYVMREFLGIFAQWVVG